MEPSSEILLHRVRACTAEGAEVTQFASRAVAGRCKRYSIRTERSHIDWIKRHILFSTTSGLRKRWTLPRSKLP
jgi:hypothetical protein